MLLLHVRTGARGHLLERSSTKLLARAMFPYDGLSRRLGEKRFYCVAAADECTAVVTV